LTWSWERLVSRLSRGSNRSSANVSKKRSAASNEFNGLVTQSLFLAGVFETLPWRHLFSAKVTKKRSAASNEFNGLVTQSLLLAGDFLLCRGSFIVS
jgi:hypothetical protein